MESLILISALLLSQSAFASSFYIYRSNPEGTVRSVSGHASLLEVTVRDGLEGTLFAQSS